MNSTEPLTELLNRPVGDERPLDQLMPLLHDRIKQLALSQMKKNAPQPTLSATALVNEAWLRIRDQHEQWQSRQHFFAVTATVMRRIIIDSLRQSHAAKRGGDRQRIDLPDAEALGLEAVSSEHAERWIELDQLLEALAEVDARAARVVECHIFGGYTFDEVAETLNVSTPTAKRDWQFARAWLKREMLR
ncbi:hypothetical protein AY599_24635 [Leptolyngbya valderiana BDU 20041]|nr:hypothetical protein AY599_24635 [Leptolyngbya valderiana BDU 20041]